MIFQIDAMVNEVLELNSNSDLIFESQGLLALAASGGSAGGNNHCAGKKNLRPDENGHQHQHQHQRNHHQRERHFLDSDGEGNDDDDNDNNINIDERSPHENLSWTFFEEISSLDKHLRSEQAIIVPSEQPVDTLQNDDENTAADVVALLSPRTCSL